jgi:hypothetical protein
LNTKKVFRDTWPPKEFAACLSSEIIQVAEKRGMTRVWQIWYMKKLMKALFALSQV